MVSETPKIKPIEPKYNLNILSDDQLQAFKSATLEILEETGIYCPSMKALNIYAEHGALVDFEKQVAKFPPQIVLEAMSSAPRYYTMGARSQNHDLNLDGTATYLATDGTGVETIDFNNTQRRASTKADVARMARITDYLSSIGFYWPMVSAQDFPSIASLHELDASFNNTVKHVQTCTVVEEKTAHYAVEMAKVISENEETMQARPPLSFLICTIAPLAMDLEATEAALVLAEAGLPVGFMSMACGGTTAPATVAGTLAIADAEMVASIVLVQMAHPGAPTYSSLMPGIMHPYTGDFDGGARETGMFYPVGVELAHKWGLPTLAAVGTSADTSGWSSAVGIASNMLMVALCGAETCSGIGLREMCTLLTPEALVLDADIYDMVRVDARGVDTSQEAFALDVIKTVGPRGHFLKEKHTRQHLRKLEFSELTTQLSNEGGYKDPIDMALEKTAWILENHYPEPLSEAQRGELKSILSSAEREIK